MAQTQPLSSYNVFHQLQQDICDIVNKSPILSGTGIEFIAENALDVDYQIKEALQKQGLAALVMTPDAEYIGQNGTSEAYQLNNLTIQFVEYTPINRAKNKESVITGLDLANYTSELLGGPNAVIGFGKLCPNGIEQGEEAGLLVTKLTFNTYIENGDTGPIIYVPFVTHEDMEAYVGDGTLTFIKDGQTIGTFSANTSSDVSIEIPNSGVWGNITGNIEYQTDLAEKLNEKASADDVIDLAGRVDQIDGKIVPTAPSTDADENALAGAKSTAEFVNSSINAFAAFYLTKNANGDAFGTYAELSSATVFYNAGVQRTPTKNDYCVVLEDETKTTSLGVDPTTRYTYQGEWPTGQFEFQYIVNNTSLTQAQVNAINSGIDSTKVAQIATNSGDIATLQSSKADKSDTYTKTEVDTSLDGKLDKYHGVAGSLQVGNYQGNPALVIDSGDNSYGSPTIIISNKSQSENGTTTAITPSQNIAPGQFVSIELPRASGTLALNSDVDAYFLKKTEASNTYATKTQLTAYALSADVTSNYTSLQLFNNTLGDLSSIIHGI